MNSVMQDIYDEVHSIAVRQRYLTNEDFACLFIKHTVLDCVKTIDQLVAQRVPASEYTEFLRKRYDISKNN